MAYSSGQTYRVQMAIRTVGHNITEVGQNLTHNLSFLIDFYILVDYLLVIDYKIITHYAISALTTYLFVTFMIIIVYFFLI